MSLRVFKLGCAKSLFSLKTCREECKTSKCTSMTSDQPCREPQATSSAGFGRQAKREAAMVSYNISDARQSGDSVTLLVDLWSYDIHLSVTLISGMLHVSNSVEMVVSLRYNCYGAWHFLLYFEFWSYNHLIGMMLHTSCWRTVILGGLWRQPII